MRLNEFVLTFVWAVCSNLTFLRSIFIGCSPTNKFFIASQSAFCKTPFQHAQLAMEQSFVLMVLVSKFILYSLSSHYIILPLDVFSCSKRRTAKTNTFTEFPLPRLTTRFFSCSVRKTAKNTKLGAIAILLGLNLLVSMFGAKSYAKNEIYQFSVCFVKNASCLRRGVCGYVIRESCHVSISRIIVVPFGCSMCFIGIC